MMPYVNTCLSLYPCLILPHNELQKSSHPTPLTTLHEFFPVTKPITSQVTIGDDTLHLLTLMSLVSLCYQKIVKQAYFVLKIFRYQQSKSCLSGWITTLILLCFTFTLLQRKCY